MCARVFTRPPSAATSRRNCGSYLLNNDTWTLPTDPRRWSRVDTGRPRSALWASGSAGPCARVDTHICKCLPALHSGECPRVCRDLTYINSEARSSQRRGILEEVGSKAWLMRRVQYPLTYPHVANAADQDFTHCRQCLPDDLHMRFLHRLQMCLPVTLTKR